MPAYDARCPRCGREFEAHVPIDKRNEILCRCGAYAVRVWRKAPGVVFNGMGWTKNESGWKSMMAEKAKSDKTLAVYNKELKDKAWEKALNEARDWTDQDHADYEAGIKALERKPADGHAAIAGA